MHKLLLLCLSRQILNKIRACVDNIPSAGYDEEEGDEDAVPLRNFKYG